VWQWRATGSVEPKERVGGRPPKVDAVCDVVLRELVAAQPDAYCWELAERLHQRTGVQVDEDTIGRALTRLGITRKKRRSRLRNSSAPT
jgi:transposase